MKILITGVAGFIGCALAQRLLSLGYSVVGIDNLNDYYDVNLKRDRLAQVVSAAGFEFFKVDIVDAQQLDAIFCAHSFGCVIHLAAQAGVRYSIDNPSAYIESNIQGYFNILEACRKHQIARLFYASSSSVYGLNEKTPFSVADMTDSPVSLYAATKKSNELMAHAYSHLFGIHTIGLRFFTVYGPWGRPDMAMFKFTKAILGEEPIDVYNEGLLSRDFTHIDDIVNGVVGLLERFTADSYAGSASSAQVFNIGNGKPVALMAFIKAIEVATGKAAQCRFLPMQDGDVETTWADTTALSEVTGYTPKIDIAEGVESFLTWYRSYYKV